MDLSAYELTWIHGSFTIVGALIGGLVTVIIYRIDWENKKIKDFENNFFEIYKTDADVLEYLIPAGIINLKDDNEIKRGLERIENRVKAPRLWLWKSEIEKVGYKKFFKTALHSGNLNDPKSILGVITKIKTDNFKKEDSKYLYK